MKTRRTLGLLAVLAVAIVPPVRAQDPALQEAVRAFDPSAAFVFESDRARVADFNGDGLADVSAILVAPERRALVVFNARRDGGYSAYPLFAVLPPGPVELRLVPPGRHPVLGPEGMIELAMPALELAFPGRSSALYAWRDGHYQIFGTENY
jgi:hypothetical protein